MREDMRAYGTRKSMKQHKESRGFWSEGAERPIKRIRRTDTQKALDVLNRIGFNKTKV